MANRGAKHHHHHHHHQELKGHGHDPSRVILMMLLKQGALTLEELEGTLFRFISQFGIARETEPAVEAPPPEPPGPPSRQKPLFLPKFSDLPEHPPVPTPQMDRKFEVHRYESFRNWILYSIRKDGLDTRDAIVRSLEKTFKTDYIPILSEFRFSLGMDMDFRSEFDEIIKPLVEENLVRIENTKVRITSKGKRRVERVFRSLRFHRST